MGDLAFERGTGWQSGLIRLGTGDAVNHAAVILLALPDGHWLVAEANADGFVVCRKPAPVAYVVRPGGPEVRAAIAAEALALTRAGLGYDWAAIARFATAILGRVQPRTRVGRVLAAPLTWTADAVAWVTHRLVRDGADRVICSGAVRRVVRAAVGVELGREGQADDETSPAELLRACYGMRDWGE